VENLDKPKLVSVPNFRDSSGSLGVIEKEEPFPFPVKRVYFLFDVAENAVRGSHAHKELHQLIVAITGSFTITLDDGETLTQFDLAKPTEALLISPGYWRTLSNFSDGSSALVLASEEYNEADYIRDYDAFKEWKKTT
jgi:dTDP-4-dehydrorhamnose 3,5-epimerase-like enzyme